MYADRTSRTPYWEQTSRVLGALIEVHRQLAPGLLESAYEACVCHELALRGIAFARQRQMPIRYKDMQLDFAYRLDLVVEGCVLVELKAVDALHVNHVAQTLTYLRLSRLPVALLVKFNARVLTQGVRRFWLSDQRSLAAIVADLADPPPAEPATDE